MRQKEVGRWRCPKCDNEIVAAGPRAESFKGTGAFHGPCPWDCGAWINRGFRSIKPGQVSVYRSDEWDRRPAATA